MTPFFARAQVALVLANATLSPIVATAISPSVKLDNGIFVGSTASGVDKFLGIPFAKPPVEDLRFRLPVANDPYTDTHDASSFGLACPQQLPVNIPLPDGIISDALDFVINGILGVIQPEGEDCLTVNVWRPSGVASGTKLPVVVWIYGGGFEVGATSTYDGAAIVSKSIQLGEPVVYVSMNYRVSAFGFLAGKEVKAAGVGNLGMQDQRLALRWVQKYVSNFGGDPSKVTIWGESAGAWSVALHMLTNGGNTEGLFRGAFMQSGSPIPVGDIEGGQQFYDALVSQTGCQGASDTLECLRQAPFDTLKKAIDKSPALFSAKSLALAWLPRADGVFLEDHPQKLVQQGSVANIPFVTGDCDDEGTLFSLSLLNITTESDVRNYIKSNYIPEISESDLDMLLTLYPQDPAQGSPYDTGVLNALSPQFKRLASLQGDLIFQAPRRFFLDQVSDKQNAWSFLNKRLKGLPGVGTTHATDIPNVYGGGDLSDYLINFINNLDPNGKTVLGWPKYNTADRQLLTLLDGLIPRALSQDTFRTEGMALLTRLLLADPL